MLDGELRIMFGISGQLDGGGLVAGDEPRVYNGKEAFIGVGERRDEMIDIRLNE